MPRPASAAILAHFGRVRQPKNMNARCNSSSRGLDQGGYPALSPLAGAAGRRLKVGPERGHERPPAIPRRDSEEAVSPRCRGFCQLPAEIFLRRRPKSRLGIGQRIPKNAGHDRGILMAVFLPEYPPDVTIGSRKAMEIESAFHPASTPDYLPATRMRELQLQRLRDVVRRAYARVPLFRQRLDNRGVNPDHIQTLEDLRRLPFTTKADLRDTYPFGLFASPMEEIVRLHASSGTTGKPIVVAYTQQDLEVWTSVMVRALAACGLHSRRRGAERLRLRPVHRRAGGALRRRIAGRHRDSRLGRQYRPADHGDEGFRRHRDLLHAQLFHPPSGAGRASWA